MKTAILFAFSLSLTVPLFGQTSVSVDQLPLYGGVLSSNDLMMVTIKSPTNTYNTKAQTFGRFVQAFTNYFSSGSTNANSSYTSPFIVVNPNGTYYTSNNLYTATNTLTSGIQEAINSLPLAIDSSHPGGGTIYLSAGTFYASTNIHFPSGISNMPFNLHIIGAGMTASGITYNGSITQNVLTAGYSQSRTPYIFSLDNMWVASSVNACTNVVMVAGASDVGGITGGGVARGWIKNCYIGYWPSMTNNNCFGQAIFTPSSCSDGLKHNLIGINVDLNFNDPFTIAECSLNYLGTAISLAGDHCVVSDNTFEQCGKGVGNDWPTSSPYFTGCAILFTEPSGGLWNGNKDWRFRGNNFVNCPLHYLTILPNLAGYYNDVNNILIQDDTDESGISLAASTGAPLTFVNPKGYYAITNSVGSTVHSALTTYYVTNAVNYTSWNTVPSTNNVVGGTGAIVILDARRGTNTVGQVFGGSVSSTKVGVGINNPTYLVDVQGTNSNFKLLRLTSDDDAFIQYVPKVTGSNWIVGATTTTSGLKSNVFVFATSAPDSSLAVVRAYIDPSNPRLVIPSRFSTPTNTSANDRILFGTGTAGDSLWDTPDNHGIALTNMLAPIGLTTNMQFSLTGTSTNTLYFTNGILYRVTQP